MHLKRVAVGMLSKSILPNALRNLKVLGAVQASMETELARLVAADAGDYAARSKLRLLRVCKVLCRDDASWKISVCILVLDIADRVLYAILGNRQQGRCTLADLVSEEKSPISQAQQSLWELLEHWGRDVRAWSLFAAMGGFCGRRDSLAMEQAIRFASELSILPVFRAPLGRPIILLG